MEFRRLDDGVELWDISVEYANSTPTLRVSGIGVVLSVLTPAAIGLGISVKRGNGGLDSVVESWSWEIISVFIS